MRIEPVKGRAQDKLRLAQRSLERGDLKRALRQAWSAALGASQVGDVHSLAAVTELAALIAAHEHARTARDAETLAVYAARCADDARERIERTPPILQLFGRSARTRVKRCPDCAETVRAAARVCRYCGFRFESETGRPPRP
jgi:hypothetical protein